MNKTIYEKLKEKAKAQNITTYSDRATILFFLILTEGSLDDRKRLVSVKGARVAPSNIEAVEVITGDEPLWMGSHV